jgi:hypothetical protein
MGLNKCECVSRGVGRSKLTFLISDLNNLLLKATRLLLHMTQGGIRESIGGTYGFVPLISVVMVMILILISQCTVVISTVMGTVTLTDSSRNDLPTNSPELALNLRTGKVNTPRQRRVKTTFLIQDRTSWADTTFHSLDSWFADTSSCHLLAVISEGSISVAGTGEATTVSLAYFV